ncbi:MAG: hypothetical protein IT381_11050 [Deltaproteobacteria bacterium]|nr:hypothetical protein [Deltaproteobacteria bacterium]
MSGFLALSRKELRLLRTYAVFLAAIIGFDALSTLLFSYPDQHTPDRPGLFSAAIGLFFVYFIVQGVAAQDDDHQTKELVFALPTPRSTIFFAKIAAVVLLLVAADALDQSIDYVFAVWSRTSAAIPLGPTHWLRLFFVNAWQTACFVCIAFFFAGFRQLGWPLVAACIAAFALAAELRPDLAILNPLTIVQYDFDGLSLIIPWKKLWATGGLSLGLGVVAGALFVLDPDTLAGALDRFKRSRWSTALVLALFFASVALLVPVLGPWAKESGPKSQSSIAEGEQWAKVRAMTERYLFSYPANEHARAAPLLEAADAVYADVRAVFGKDAGALIAVDLGGSREGTLGTTHWTEVHIDFSQHDTLAAQKETLAHETAHVFISVLADRRLDDRFADARFFHEGLANYVQLQTYGTPQKKENRRFVASVLHAQRRARFELLIDSARMTRDYDAEDAYTLGGEFVTALVAIYGQGAPAKLLEAIAAAPDLRGENGPAFWRAAFQAAGFQLDSVIARYTKTLEAARVANEQRIDALPALAAGVRKSDGRYFVVLAEDLPEELRLRCQVRRSERDPPHAGLVRGNSVCAAPSAAGEKSLQYALGVESSDEGWTIFSPWVDAPIANVEPLDAAAWRELHERGCDNGDGGYCFAAGEDAEKAGENADATAWFRVGCALGHTQACVRAPE